MTAATLRANDDTVCDVGTTAAPGEFAAQPPVYALVKKDSTPGQELSPLLPPARREPGPA